MQFHVKVGNGKEIFIRFAIGIITAIIVSLVTFYMGKVG